MKPLEKGWKEGIIAKDLRSVGGGYTHKAGDTVRYKRFKTRGRNNIWTGEYEYYYLDQNNYNLVRSTKLLIDIK